MCWFCIISDLREFIGVITAFSNYVNPINRQKQVLHILFREGSEEGF